jgi:HAD superfamily hydrolase (TIGR01509 family)
MHPTIKAVIFDMDGVLIDSEPLWRTAMVKGFKQFGMTVTEEECKTTMGRRINEVVNYWVNIHSVNPLKSPEIEKTIIEVLLNLIEKEGEAIAGVIDLLNFCKSKHLKIGLATSSSELLMQTVLNKLQIKNHFNSVVSAQNLKYGKPNPEVFLICAENLGVNPTECVVIEDSINGAIAAKAAQMHLIVVPDANSLNPEKFSIADYNLDNMNEVLNLFKTHF